MTEIKWATPNAMATAIAESTAARGKECYIQYVEKILNSPSCIGHSMVEDGVLVHGQPKLYRKKGITVDWAYSLMTRIRCMEAKTVQTKDQNSSDQNGENRH